MAEKIPASAYGVSGKNDRSILGSQPAEHGPANAAERPIGTDGRLYSLHELRRERPYVHARFHVPELR